MSVKTNDVFQLDQHFLGCGSSLNTDMVKSLIGDRKIALILTDPPYGVGYVETKSAFNKIRKQKIIANDQLQSEGEYREFTKLWLEAIKPFLAQKNSIYIFNSDKMLFALREAMSDTDIKFSQLLIWIKSNVVMGRLNFLPQHELVIYGWFGTHQFMKSQDKSVIFYPKPHKSPYHPTMKPVGLLRRLILNSSRVGDYIYDPFLGSGSTLLACEQTKRRCISIELDSEYCQTVINRWEKLTGLKAKKISV